MTKLTEQEIRRLGEAIALFSDIHKNDIYGDGPYVFHLLQVLKTVQEQGEDLSTMIVAMGHDSLEDHPEEAGRIFVFLTPGEFASLKAISRGHFGPETYNEFIDRVILDPRAAIVKLADLQRNSAPKGKRS